MKRGGGRGGGGGAIIHEFIGIQLILEVKWYYIFFIKIWCIRHCVTQSTSSLLLLSFPHFV